MLRHQWDEARQINDAILKERPKDVDALVRRAELQFQAGDVRGSIAELEEALRLNPNNPLARYDLGHALLANKQPERARYEFSEAIRWAPANIAARLELAQIQIDSGEFGKAVAAAEEALAYRPADHTAHMIRAIGLRGMKKYDQARAELNSLLAAKPDSPDVLYQLAALDALLGKWKEAEAGYRKSYEVNPANTDQRYILWSNGRVDNINAPAITSGPNWYARIDQPVGVALQITNWATGGGYILDFTGKFNPINGAPPMGTGGYVTVSALCPV